MGTLVLCLLLGGDLGRSIGPCARPDAVRLVSETPLPDPFVFRDGQCCYVFGTSGVFLQGKELAPESMKPVPLEIDFGPGSPRWQVWSFSVYRHTDGSYHAYATVHYGQFKTAVAHFVPADGQIWSDGKPITRWKFDRALAGSDSENGPFAYDARAFHDRSGLYLVYSTSARRHANVSVVARRLFDPGKIDRAFPERTLLAAEGYRSEDRNPGYIQLVEGASITKIGDTYVMLYSVGDFGDRNYKLGVAYSDRLIPPMGKTYAKPLIEDKADVWGSKRGKEVAYLLQSEKSGWPNYCADAVIGPGLGTIVTDESRFSLVFHGYKPGDAERRPGDRHVWTVPLEVDISGGRPMSEWIRCHSERSEESPADSSLRSE